MFSGHHYVVVCDDKFVAATPDSFRMPTCGRVEYWDMVRLSALQSETRDVYWTARYTDKPMMYFGSQQEAVQMVRDMHALGLRDTERWGVTISH